MVSIRFITYSTLEGLSAEQRIKSLLSEAREAIVLFEGRLRAREEALLIQRTMESIDRRFHGIELAVLHAPPRGFSGALRGLLLGQRAGFTVIGPASFVKEMKKHPERVELVMR